MARYTGPVCRLCRRERTKLFLKGERCLSLKCPMSENTDRTLRAGRTDRAGFTRRTRRTDGARLARGAVLTRVAVRT